MVNKRNRGITLIALVITIIVIIILATAVIITLSNNNPIEQANRAKEEHEIQGAKEKINLAILTYEAKLREESLYSFLQNVPGINSIDPDNSLDGPPYVVDVDGYWFELRKEDDYIVIDYIGKADGVAPKITKVEKQVKNEKETVLKIEANTSDKLGLYKVVLLYKGSIVEEKEVTGNNIKEEFTVTNNGEHIIKVVAANRKQAKTDPINVTEIVSISGMIKSGTVIDRSVLLTVDGSSSKEKVKKLEIYVRGIKRDEKIYPEGKTAITEQITINDLGFYEDVKSYAILTDELGNTKKTNEVTVKNISGISNLTELKKLQSIVNGGDPLTGKTINILQDINLNGSSTNQWVPIGNAGNPFSGTFNGNNKKISNIYINNSSDQQAFIGFTDKATIKNIQVQGTISAKNRIAGVVGEAVNTKIENCINSATINSAGSSSGGIVGHSNSGTNITGCINNGNVTMADASLSVYGTGGITGHGVNVNITKCVNNATITNNTGSAGGIVGGFNNTEAGFWKITSSYNKGTIRGGENIGGIIGAITRGNVETDSCYNIGDLYGNNYVSGMVGLINASLNVVNLEVKNSYNTGILNCNFATGGIIGGKLNNPYLANLTITNSYYLNTCNANSSYAYGAISKTMTEMQNIAGTLGPNFKANTSYVNNNYYPILAWQ